MGPLSTSLLFTFCPPTVVGCLPTGVYNVFLFLSKGHLRSVKRLRCVPFRETTTSVSTPSEDFQSSFRAVGNPKSSCSPVRRKVTVGIFPVMTLGESLEDHEVSRSHLSSGRPAVRSIDGTPCSTQTVIDLSTYLWKTTPLF